MPGEANIAVFAGQRHALEDVPRRAGDGLVVSSTTITERASRGISIRPIKLPSATGSAFGKVTDTVRSNQGLRPPFALLPVEIPGGAPLEQPGIRQYDAQ